MKNNKILLNLGFAIFIELVGLILTLILNNTILITIGLMSIIISALFILYKVLKFDIFEISCWYLLVQSALAIIYSTIYFIFGKTKFGQMYGMLIVIVVTTALGLLLIKKKSMTQIASHKSNTKKALDEIKQVLDNKNKGTPLIHIEQKEIKIKSKNKNINQPKKTTSKKYILVAAKSGTKYHTPDCKMIEKTPDKNLIKFRSVSEAKELNLKPCKMCKAVNYLNRLY